MRPCVARWRRRSPSTAPQCRCAPWPNGCPWHRGPCGITRRNSASTSSTGTSRPARSGVTRCTTSWSTRCRRTRRPVLRARVSAQGDTDLPWPGIIFLTCVVRLWPAPQRDHQQRFVRLQRTVEHALDETPPPTLETVAARLGRGANGLRQHFPALCGQIDRAAPRVSARVLPSNAATRVWRKSARSPSRSTRKASSPPSTVSPRSSPDHAISPAMPNTYGRSDI